MPDHTVQGFDYVDGIDNLADRLHVHEEVWQDSASLPASSDLSAGTAPPVPSRTLPAPATRLLPWLHG